MNGPRRAPTGVVSAPLTVAPVPITPDMLTALATAITSGVTDVKYADREIKYGSLAELLKAYQWAWAQLYGYPGTRQRTVACFSKGLPPSSPSYVGCGPEHGEVAVPLPQTGPKHPDSMSALPQGIPGGRPAPDDRYTGK